MSSQFPVCWTVSVHMSTLLTSYILPSSLLQSVILAFFFFFFRLSASLSKFGPLPEAVPAPLASVQRGVEGRQRAGRSRRCGPGTNLRKTERDRYELEERIKNKVNYCVFNRIRPDLKNERYANGNNTANSPAWRIFKERFLPQCPTPSASIWSGNTRMHLLRIPLTTMHFNLQSPPVLPLTSIGGILQKNNSSASAGANRQTQPF